MYSTEFQIGDTVRLIDDGNVYSIVSFTMTIHFSANGGVKINHILYLGNGLWRSANACELVSKRKSR